MLRASMDTDGPEAREWALAQYRRYREEAEEVKLPVE